MASTLGKRKSNNNNNKVKNRHGWWYDTGAAAHICNDKSQFRTYRECTNLRVRVANGAFEDVAGRGNIDLKFTSGQILTLVDVYHVPDVVLNLISGGRINKTGVKLVIEADSLTLSKDNVIIGKGYYYSSNGLFHMDLMKSNSSNTAGVPAAIPVKRVCQAGSNSSHKLGSIYRRPLNLVYKGSFHEAKQEAERQGKWMIVNLQSTQEFSSRMLNRDTWSNESLAEMISNYFIFWQGYDDIIEGQAVCKYYNLASLPVVFVLDPISGKKAQLWSGMVEAKILLEELQPFIDEGPKSDHVERPSKQKSMQIINVDDDSDDDEVIIQL